MKKKMLTAAFCAAVSMALCACNTTGPAGAKNPTVTVAPTATSAPTATPTAIEEAYAGLPIMWQLPYCRRIPWAWR